LKPANSRVRRKLDDLLLPIMLTAIRNATKAGVYIASRLINCIGVINF